MEGRLSERLERGVPWLPFLASGNRGRFLFFLAVLNLLFLAVVLLSLRGVEIRWEIKREEILARRLREVRATQVVPLIEYVYVTATPTPQMVALAMSPTPLPPTPIPPSPTKVMVPPPRSRTTPTPTAIGMATPTVIPTPTPTFTPGPPPPHDTPTPAPEPRRRRTPTPTPTCTTTPAPTDTPTPTPTPTDTPTPTPTPTDTPTPTPTPTPTDTPTPTSTSDPPPAPPQGLRAAGGDGQVSLGWEANSEPDLAGYILYRSTTPGSGYEEIATLSTTDCLDTGLTNGESYYYLVKAFDTFGGQSDPSDEVQATPSAITEPYPSCVIGNCNDAQGPPDGVWDNIHVGEEIILDLGEGNGIIDGDGYDLVYYEREYLDTGKVQLDWVIVELSADGSSWHTVFYWGDGVPSVNTNIASYATDGDGEADNEEIPFDDLWPSSTDPVYQTGVAIDIEGLAPSGFAYRYLRISCPGDGGDPAEPDAIERLN